MLGQLEGVVRPFQSEQAFNRALNKEAKEEPREAIAEWGVAGDAEIALVSSFTGFSTLPATNYKEQYRQVEKVRVENPDDGSFVDIERIRNIAFQDDGAFKTHKFTLNN